MTIEVKGPEEQSHIENVFYDVRCLNCADISKESGDLLDRPLEIVGFEEQATFEQARAKAEEHDREYPKHRITIRTFDAGLIQEYLGIEGSEAS